MQPPEILVHLVVPILLATLISATDVSYTIDEEEDAGYVVGNIAVDLDIPIDASTRFVFLTTPLPNETYFTLNSETGELTTTVPIDRESLCQASSLSCEYELNIIVQPSFQVINVYVTIADVNDHTPFFDEEITNLAIPESVAIGTRFPLSTATDDDVGNNTIQDYRLSDEYSDTFGLIVNKYVDGSITVQLEVLGDLDRETVDNYQMTLFADDWGQPSLSGETFLNISVLDSDDHSPSFVRDEYTVAIAEDVAVGQEILQVEAVDPDTGTNGQIIYSFGGSVSSTIRQLFDIDSSSGALTVKSGLDYEQSPTLQLTVRATNNVPNPVPDFAVVTINIIDVNDNKPQMIVSAIDGTGRVKHLIENSDSGTPVAFVRVSDPDSGINRQVTLSLEDHDDDFYLEAIGADQYFLKTAVELDREELEVYNITILAQDAGSPMMTSRKKFIVYVDDVNDNSPEFSSYEYHATISENNQPGHRVATVSAFDPDENENGDVVYSLLENEGGLFRIDSTEGVLTVDASLDREETDSVELVVRACDHGQPPRCTDAPLTVNVLDQNDNTPDFGGDLFELAVYENEPVDTFVGRVSATDNDDADNGRLRYSIIEDANFRIDADNGRIYTQAEFDRESQELHHFTVQVADNGLSPKTATTTVVVTVLDVNDHSPQFDIPNANDDIRFIPLSADPGFRILKVQTHDDDEGTNAMVTYALSSGNTLGAFGVKANGAIVTAQQLDSDWIGVHDVTVRATDGGLSDSTARSSMATLRIVIADENFNASLPPDNFTAMFNLSIANYLDPIPNNNASKNFINDWPMVVIISLAGCAVILVIVFLLVAARCRTKNREQGKYIVPPGELDLFAIRQAPKNADNNAKASDTDSGLTSTASNMSSVQSKNIMKWRAQHERDQESITSSQRGSSKSGAQPGLPSSTNVDGRLGNRQMSTFGSNSDLQSESIASITSARRTPDPDAEVHRLLRKLHVGRDIDTLSDRTSDGNGSSSYDSGHGGESDRDGHAGIGAPNVWNQNRSSIDSGGSSRRSASYPRIAALAAQNVPKTPSGGHRHSYMASPHCTPECLRLGHSDECWMPNPSAFAKSKTVHFSKSDDARSSGSSYRSYQSHDRPPATGPKPPNPAIAFGNVSRVSQNHKPLPSGPGVGQAVTNRDLNGYHSNSPSVIQEDERNGNILPLSPIREHPSERTQREKRNSTPSVIVTVHSPDKYKNDNHMFGNGDVRHHNEMNRLDSKQSRLSMNGAPGMAHRNGGNNVHNGHISSSPDSASFSSSSGSGSEVMSVRYSPDEVEAVLEKCGGDLSSGVSLDGEKLYTDWV